MKYPPLNSEDPIPAKFLEYMAGSWPEIKHNRSGRRDRTGATSLKFIRQRFQRGTLRKVARANNRWAWEYRYQDPSTMKRESLFLGLDNFPRQAAAERHLEAFVLTSDKLTVVADAA